MGALLVPMHGQRSFWGWGFADRFPDREGRTAIASQASVMLGFASGEVKEPPRIEDLELAKPRITPPSALAELIHTSAEERALHTYGRSYRDIVLGFAGDFSCAPDLVATPADEAQIEAILEWCSRERIAVVPFGGGTSVVRGVEAPVDGGYRGAISLDLRRFDRVIEVDPISRAARIQAGATGPVLEAQLAHHGLTLRHYPQSYEHSTLGGWIATRAGGHYATLRTRIDDFVESVRMIAPSGLWQSRRLPSSGAGPSPDRWVLGSEGTLGVITEAWVRVTERPKWRSRASLHFDDILTAATAARHIVQAGLHPANCRVLDPIEARFNAVTATEKSVLLLGFESSDQPVEAPLLRAIELARSAGGHLADPPKSTGPDTARPGGDADRWRDAFFSAPYLQTALLTCGMMVDTFETACTWDRFDALHHGVIAAVKDALVRVAGTGHVSCRITHVYPDGPAPYFTFFGPARQGGEIAQWTEIKTAASEAVLRLGGTITHHHAVGRLHRPWYDRERPGPFAEALRAAKRSLDPAGILNPGVLIDPLP